MPDTAGPGSPVLSGLAPCGLVLTDAAGTILELNPTFGEWLGYGTSDALLGKRFHDLMTVGARMFHQTHWQPLLHLQGSVSEVKMDFRHRDGRKVPMVVNARTATSEAGETLHAIAAFVVADRDRYEQELLKARAQAEELLRQRTALQAETADRGRFAEQMLGIVSHDLRNPLTAIRMGAEMLALDEQDPKRLRLASRINESVDRALKLIADLLDFTLARTGQSLSIQRASLDLHRVVAEGIEELRLVYPRAQLLHSAVGTETVTADAERLLQVLGNLVSNAQRYGDTRQATTITTSIDKGVAILQVHNCGQPIAAELMPNLFLAMSRGAHVHDAGGGVGLGLYIVSEIAQGHGGGAFAQSSEADGTCIGISFPAIVQG